MSTPVGSPVDDSELIEHARANTGSDANSQLYASMGVTSPIFAGSRAHEIIANSPLTPERSLASPPSTHGVQRLQAKVESLLATIEAKNEALADVKEAAVHLQAKNDEQSRELRSMQREVSELTHDIEHRRCTEGDLRMDIERLKLSIQSLRSDKASSEAAVKERDTRIAALERKLNGALAEMNGLSAKITALNQEHEVEKHRWADERAELKKQCMQRFHTVEAAKQQLSDQGKELAKVAERLAGSHRREQQLRSTVEAQQQVTEKLHDAIRRLRDQTQMYRKNVQALEQAVVEAREEAGAFQERYESATQALVHNRGTQEAMSDTEAQLRALLMDRQTEIQTLQEQVEDAKRQAVEEGQRVKAAKKEVEDLSKALQSNNDTINDLRRQQSAKEHEVSALADKAEELQYSTAQLTSELEAVRANLAQTQSDYDELSQTEAATQQQKQALEAELGVANRRVADLEARVSDLDKELLRLHSARDRDADQTGSINAALAKREEELQRSVANNKELSANVRKQQDEIADLSDKLMRLSAGQQRMERVIADLEADNSRLRDALTSKAALATQQTEQIAELGRIERELSKQLDDARGDRDRFQEESEALKRKTSMLSQSQAEATGKSSSLAEETSALQHELAALRSTVEAKEVRVSELDRLVAQQIEEMAELHENLEAALVDAAENKTALRHTEAALQDATQERKGLQERCDAASKRLAELEACVPAQDANMAELNDQLAEAAAELATARQTVATLRTDRDEAQGRTRQLSDKLDETVAQLRLVSEQNETLARRTLNQMQESDAELRNRDSTVQALQGAIAELENSKRELETLLRVSQQELQGAEEAAERQRAETRRERAARNQVADEFEETLVMLREAQGRLSDLERRDQSAASEVDKQLSLIRHLQGRLHEETKVRELAEARLRKSGIPDITSPRASPNYSPNHSPASARYSRHISPRSLGSSRREADGRERDGQPLHASDLSGTGNVLETSRPPAIDAGSIDGGSDYVRYLERRWDIASETPSEALDETAVLERVRSQLSESRRLMEELDRAEASSDALPRTDQTAPAMQGRDDVGAADVESKQGAPGSA